MGSEGGGGEKDTDLGHREPKRTKESDLRTVQWQRDRELRITREPGVTDAAAVTWAQPRSSTRRGKKIISSFQLFRSKMLQTSSTYVFLSHLPPIHQQSLSSLL